MKKTSGKKTKALCDLVNVVTVFALLFGMTIATSAAPKVKFSENQNRYLADPPRLTFKRYFSGAFTDDAENYISDHFIFHDGFVAMRTRLDMLQGHSDVNGVYILENRLVEKIAPPDDSVTEKSIAAINAVAAGTNTPCYIMLVPTQAQIYSGELPSDAPNPDQKQYIDDVYARIEGIGTIDVYSPLSAASNEYIYYRNDHHWTTQGAYIAYATAGRRLGYEPFPAAGFDIDHSPEDFRGTFYSKTLYPDIPADRLDLYLHPAQEKCTLDVYGDVSAEPAVHEGLYFREFLSRKDKYSTFLGTNQPKITIHTGNEGGKLLIFKDSYAHCLVPFLAAHYSEITIADSRYVQLPYRDYADPDDYDQVLFLYNVSTFMDGIRIV